MTNAEFRDKSAVEKAEILMAMTPQQLIAFWEQFDSPYVDGLTRAWRAERTIGTMLVCRLREALERIEALEAEEPSPDQCAECDEIAAGYSDGTPYCAAHYQSRPSINRSDVSTSAPHDLVQASRDSEL